MKYKALMMDLDGTTIPNRRDGMPSPKVTAAVKKAKHLLHVGVATSRPYSGAKHVTTVLELTGPSVVNGGAQIVDISTDKELWERPISVETMGEIKQTFQKHKKKFATHDKGRDIWVDEAYIPYKPLGCFSEHMLPHEAASVYSDLTLIPQTNVIQMGSWEAGKDLLLVSHPEATKRNGILEVAKLLSIDPSEIIGIGDGENDLSLLTACGLKVAMGNASDDLKAIADYIAPAVDEDGLAHVIETFILS